MKKLTDTLSRIKNIFCRQQNSADVTSAGCFEFPSAAQRTRGGRGLAVEGNDMDDRVRQWN